MTARMGSQRPRWHRVFAGADNQPRGEAAPRNYQFLILKRHHSAPADKMHNFNAVTRLNHMRGISRFRHNFQIMFDRNLFFGQSQARQQLSHANGGVKRLRLTIYDPF